MQALKTIADSAYRAAQSEPDATIHAATAYACGSNVLYLAKDGGMVAREIDPFHSGGSLAILERSGQEFTESYATTHALALLYGGSLLMARGCVRPQDSASSASLGFWNVKSGNRVVEKVRDVTIQSPNHGAVCTWAWLESEHTFTVALAFADIHCSVQLLTFKRAELRPTKTSSQTIQVAKDSNGDSTITNVHLLRSEEDNTSLRVLLTISQKGGAARIESRSVDPRQSPPDITTLEATNVPPGHSTEFGSNQVIVVTSSDHLSPMQSYSSQVSTFTAESRVTCLPYQHPVRGSVRRIDNHTLALATSNRRGDDCVTVLDIKNRLELTTHVLRFPLKALIPSPLDRSVLILHEDGSATALTPKPLAQQVSSITQRKHYKEAIGVAEDALARAVADSAAAESVRELIANTEAKFATHLLERAGEPEAAMHHYIRTIGYLSVSTVIQKFLHTQHTELLKLYLEAVAQRPEAMKAAYAAVLLSLYVQMRDREALKAFLDASMPEQEDGSRGPYIYDVGDAVDACLNGGYHEEARSVAEASGRHAKTVDICLCHIGGEEGGKKALEYLVKLPRPLQASLLHHHGKALISKFKLEMQVTPIIHRLCTPSSTPGDDHVAHFGRFVPLYDDAPGALRVLCDLLLVEWLQGKDTAAGSGSDGTPSDTSQLQLIFHQLLELQLDPSRNEGPDGLDEEERERQALAVLKMGWPAGAQEGACYDREHALLLCHSHSFKAGLIFLCERMHDYTRRQQVLVEYKDWEGLVALGKERPGDRGQHIITVLRELVREADSEPLSDAHMHIRSLLAHISSDAGLSDVLTPLAVIGVLQRSETLTLDVAKDFIRDYVGKQQDKARFNESKIAELQAETEALASDVQQKHSSPLWVSDEQAPGGSRVGRSAVFFFCGHAFDEESCERRPDTGTFVCATCQLDPAKQRIRRSPEVVERWEANEKFFTEIRNRTNAGVFEIIAHHLASSGSLI